MKDTYDTAMTKGVYPHEGGYTDEAADPGGPTNWGITIADARQYWKPTANAADVKSMPKSVAEDIYRKHYADPLRYDDLPAGVDYAVLDYGINSGVSRSAKVLRRLVGMPDNVGTITVDVITAVRKRDAVTLVNAICDERLKFLQGLKNWPTYKSGWTRRVVEVRQLSISLWKSQGVIAVTAPISTSKTPGKGQVAKPTTAKNVVISAGGAGGAGLIAWAHMHPAWSLLAIGATLAVIGGLIYALNSKWRSAQDAATPGIKPVSEVA